MKEHLKDYIEAITTEENETNVLFILRTKKQNITTKSFSKKLLSDNKSFCIEMLKQAALRADDKRCVTCVYNERESLCENKYQASAVHDEFKELTALKYDEFGMDEIVALIVSSDFGCRNHFKK
jgi:hypothetical protein